MMPVDRITVTLPVELGRELRQLASALDVPVSSLVVRAVESQLRQQALGAALKSARRRVGPIDPEIAAEVGAAFDTASRATPRRAAPAKRTRTRVA